MLAYNIMLHGFDEQRYWVHASTLSKKEIKHASRTMPPSLGVGFEILLVSTYEVG